MYIRGVGQIFLIFTLAFSLFLLKLSLLSLFFFFSDGRWAVGKESDAVVSRPRAAAPPRQALKPTLFYMIFRLPTPFYLLIPILAPKFSKYGPITLDLMKYKLKHGLPLPYASFTDLVRLDLLRPYVVLV